MMQSSDKAYQTIIAYAESHNFDGLPLKAAMERQIADDPGLLTAFARAEQREAKKASDHTEGGEQKMRKTIQGSGMVMETLRTYARHHQRQGESDDEAFLRACSEQPSLCASYNDARMSEAARGIPPESVRPQPTKATQPADLTAEKAVLEAALRVGAEACGMDYLTYCTTGDGKDEAMVLDVMTTRTMSRTKAVRFLGKE